MGRVLLNLVKNDKLTMVHELFAWGKDPNKKAAKGKCAGSMMQQLYRLGIVGSNEQSIHQPGLNAKLYRVTKPRTQEACFEPNDIYCMNKLDFLRPTAKELDYPAKVIAHLESALRNISDLVHQNEIQNGYSRAVQGKRTLLGIQRVGPVAMDMMIAGERRLHIVLACGRRPTKKLLENVARKMIEMLSLTERGFANYEERKEHLNLL